MGTLALAAKITHVPSMYLSEIDGPAHGKRQDAIDGHTSRSAGAAAAGRRHHRRVRHALAGQRRLPRQLRAPHWKGVHEQRAAVSATWPTRQPATQRLGVLPPGRDGARRVHSRPPGDDARARVRHAGADALHERRPAFPRWYRSRRVHRALPGRQRAARLGLPRAIEDRYDGTVAIFASGSPSHRFAQNGPPTDLSRVRIKSPFSNSWTDVSAWAGGRVGRLLRHAARVRGQGPRRGLHAQTPRCCSARSAGTAYDGGVEIVTPSLPARAPGQINAVVPGDADAADLSGIGKPSTPALVRRGLGDNVIRREVCRPTWSILYTPQLTPRRHDPLAARSPTDADGRDDEANQVFPPAACACCLPGGALRGGRRQRRPRLRLLQPAHGPRPQRHGPPGAGRNAAATARITRAAVGPGAASASRCRWTRA